MGAAIGIGRDDVCSSAVNWTEVPRDGGRIWGPDLFAYCWDALDDADSWSGFFRPENAEDICRTWIEPVRAGAGWIAESFMSLVDGSGLTEGEARLRLLVAIDRAYAGMALGTSPGHPQVSPVYDQWWASGGNVAVAASGLVLRRGSVIRAGRGLSRYCQNLTRVRPPAAGRVHVVRNEKWSLGGRLWQERLPRGRLRIAVIPTLTSAIDTAFDRVQDGAAALFSVRLNEKRQADITQAVPELVRALEEDQVHVAVFPETVATPATATALANAIEVNFAKRLDDGHFPTLSLAAIGVASGTSNEAWLIGADGKVLLRQAKQQGWLLTTEQQARHGIQIAGQRVDRREALAEHGQLWLLEDESFGRVAVLICEDLARVTSARTMLELTGPRLVLSPVLDGGLSRARWAYRAASAIADEPGSLVVVANSLALVAMAAAASPGKPQPPPGFAIVHPPGHGGTVRRSYLPDREYTVQRVPLEWLNT